jgi:hypothetical protein
LGEYEAAELPTLETDMFKDLMMKCPGKDSLKKRQELAIGLLRQLIAITIIEANLPVQ